MQDSLSAICVRALAVGLLQSTGQAWGSPHDIPELFRAENLRQQQPGCGFSAEAAVAPFLGPADLRPLSADSAQQQLHEHSQAHQRPTAPHQPLQQRQQQQRRCELLCTLRDGLPTELKAALIAALAGYRAVTGDVIRSLLTHADLAQSLTSLQLSDCCLLPGGDLAAALAPGPWPRLHTLNLRKVQLLRDEDLALIAAPGVCPSLTDLDVGGCVLLTSRALVALAGGDAALGSAATPATRKEHSSSEMRDAAAAEASGPSVVQPPSSCAAPASPAAVLAFGGGGLAAGTLGLQRLSITGCWQVADPEPLGKLTRLRSLDLSGCWQLVQAQGTCGGAPAATVAGASPLPSDATDASAVVAAAERCGLGHVAAALLARGSTLTAGGTQGPSRSSASGSPERLADVLACRLPLLEHLDLSRIPHLTSTVLFTSLAPPTDGASPPPQTDPPLAPTPAFSSLALYSHLTSLDVRDTDFSGAGLLLLSLAAPRLAHLSVSGCPSLQGSHVGRFCLLRGLAVAWHEARAERMSVGAGWASNGDGQQGGLQGGFSGVVEGEAGGAVCEARGGGRQGWLAGLGLGPGRPTALLSLVATNLSWDEWGDEGDGEEEEAGVGNGGDTGSLEYHLLAYARRACGQRPASEQPGGGGEAPLRAVAEEESWRSEVEERLMEAVRRPFSSVNELFEPPQLQALTSLTSLDLSGSRANDLTLAHVAAHCSATLQSLSVARCPDVGDDGLQHLWACTQLTRLDLSHCSGSGARRAPGAGFARHHRQGGRADANGAQAGHTQHGGHWGAAAPGSREGTHHERVPKRARLHMGGVTDVGAAALLSQLCTASGRGRASEQAPQHLPPTPTGESQWARADSGCTSAAGAIGLACGPAAAGGSSAGGRGGGERGLRDLRLAGTAVADGALREARGLTCLDLTGCKRVTDQGMLQALMLSPELRSLRLASTACTPHALGCPGTPRHQSPQAQQRQQQQQPSRCRSLQRLSLPRDACTPALLAWLPTSGLALHQGWAAGLRKLDLTLPSGGGVTSGGTSASVSGTAAAAAGSRSPLLGPNDLAALAARCPGLHSLSLRGAGVAACVTDSSVKALADACPLLQRLTLQGATWLSDRGLASLLTHLPALQLLDITGATSLRGSPFLALLLGAARPDLGWDVDTAASLEGEIESRIERLMDAAASLAGTSAAPEAASSTPSGAGDGDGHSGAAAAPALRALAQVAKLLQQGAGGQRGLQQAAPAPMLRSVCLERCSAVSEPRLAALMLACPFLEALTTPGGASSAMSPRLQALQALVLRSAGSAG